MLLSRPQKYHVPVRICSPIIQHKKSMSCSYAETRSLTFLVTTCFSLNSLSLWNILCWQQRQHRQVPPPPSSVFTVAMADKSSLPLHSHHVDMDSSAIPVNGFWNIRRNQTERTSRVHLSGAYTLRPNQFGYFLSHEPFHPPMCGPLLCVIWSLLRTSACLGDDFY